MSIILDALKKLEQKQEKGSVPDIMTVHLDELQKSPKRPIWFYMVLAALIMNAGILVLLLRPRVTEKKDPSTSSVSLYQDRAKLSETDQNHLNKENLTSPLSSLGNENISNDKKTSDSNKIISQDTAHIIKEPRQLQPQLNDHNVKNDTATKSLYNNNLNIDISSHTLNSKTSLNPSSAPINKSHDINKGLNQQTILEYSQLPQSVQGEIPSITVFGHVYSDSPATRMVNINGDILREGDLVSNKLKVEEITENGVIMNYQGHRFSYRVF